jgi:hypothetical protein
MMSYRIWIPSKQAYCRMYEITCEQYRNVLKSIEDSDNFNYFTNQIILQNFVSAHDICTTGPTLTLIDKFIIILQLKVYSCNTNLKLTRECSKCGNKTDFTIDLNKLIDSLAPVVDRSFKKIVTVGTYAVECDIPNINKGLSVEDLTDDQKLNRYLYSFIKDISFNESKLLLNTRPEEEKFRICQSIPYKVTYAVKTQFVDNIHNIFKELMFLKTRCKEKSCGDELEIKFDVLNIDDIIKILFRDSNNINILQQYAAISHKCHFDYSFYKSICPAELETLYNMVQESTKTDNDEQNTNQDIDLFQQYRSQTQGMVESASEFK